MVRRWCRTFSDGRQQVEDILRAGRTSTATTDANVWKVDDMIRANRRITIYEVAEELGISHERAQNIIHDILRYRKVSARWVPRQLTSTHQEQRMAVSLKHLVRYHEDGNDFLFRIVTGDETWVHHFTPESKAASMEWKHPSSPVRKKFKTTPSAGKVLLTVFWDAQGVLLLDSLELFVNLDIYGYIIYKADPKPRCLFNWIRIGSLHMDERTQQERK
ncbi:histone-lysine N-methyltransferase SETMAR [Trichonephila clavata]|uniref:Histone-lysine N-methyltransferase SETMAR n=1 Tax=Trichonephila clavata TaxID=2740835 RepID=A0A8X6GWX6_TRICU|nr:histone-lysine N-methyltransferase SETMAR [Trichonephila clavata]